MKIHICYDENLCAYLCSRGLQCGAYGYTPTNKKKYWVYTESPAYIKLIEDYEKQKEED